MLGVVLFQHLDHFCVRLTDHRKAFQYLSFQLGECGGRNGGSFGAIFVDSSSSSASSSVSSSSAITGSSMGASASIRPSTNSSARISSVSQLVHQCQQVGNGAWTGGNGLHHVFEAVFDTLGDLNLALAGKQIYRTHFTHVHAYRVGGTGQILNPLWKSACSRSSTASSSVTAAGASDISSTSASGASSYT